jgi:hypothetical protein
VPLEALDALVVVEGLVEVFEEAMAMVLERY